MRLALLALASVLVPSPVAPANVFPMMVIQPESIVQVFCFEKGYISAGTAFRIGPSGLGLSVNHVAGGSNCYIAGKALNLTYKSPTADFSEITLGEGPYLPIDCGGFIKGKRYLSLGYARGQKNIITLEMTATGESDHGQALLYGMVPVIPGMSGGPVLDEETGRVVGVVNAENFEEGLSWSVPLSQTPVCKQGIA